jgi:hypothetical protein
MLAKGSSESDNMFYLEFRYLIDTNTLVCLFNQDSKVSITTVATVTVPPLQVTPLQVTGINYRN